MKFVLLKVALKTQKCRNQTIFEVLPKPNYTKIKIGINTILQKKGLVSSAIKMDLNDSHPSPPFDP